jgi:hypothetical protein
MKRSDWRDWPVLTTRVFASGHPALAGHFPVRPVLPGVLLLDWACQELAPAHPLAVREARFARPCDLDRPLALRAPAHRDGVIGFAITQGEGSGEAVVVSGTLALP